MDNLPLPSRDTELADLGTAIQVVERAGVVSGYDADEDELQAIVQLYDEYDASGGVGELLDSSALDPGLLETIKNGYSKTYENGALKHLRSELQSKVKRCPICGIGPAKELDHYLAKAHYQVFAIYVRNLVPICHDCNNSKKTHGTGTANERFIHAYFDQLPEDHLSVELALENDALLTTYGVSDLSVGNEEIEQRIGFQLGRLRLSERWSDEVIIYLSAHEDALESAFDADGAQGVAQFLTRQAIKEERRFGRSSWRPVLLRALSNSEEFCDNGFNAILKFDDNEAD